MEQIHKGDVPNLLVAVFIAQLEPFEADRHVSRGLLLKNLVHFDLVEAMLLHQLLIGLHKALPNQAIAHAHTPSDHLQSVQ